MKSWMKSNWLCFALAFLLLCLCSCAAAAEETATVLVYLCCSEDLQDAAYEDLAEMAEAETGEAVNLLVLAGGSSSWDIEEFDGNARTLAVIRDGYLEEVKGWGKASMGSPESLEEFLAYGMTEYPADRTVVILWDHGAGTEGGICFDESANDDGLTVVEISEVLESLRQSVPDYHINIFGCDACMMATYEMAAMLSHHNVGYFIASEELEPGTGWYYTSWLTDLADDPSVPDSDLCRAIIDDFMEAALAEDPDDYLTLSAVSLPEIQKLEASMERFASVLSGQLQSGNLSAVRRGRSRLYTFGSYDDASWDMVDLGAVLDTYAQFDPDNAAEAKRCLSRSVVHNRQTDNLETCSGLSILLPQDTTNEFEEYRDGIALASAIPNWVDFISGYASMLRGGHYHFTVSDAEQITGGSEITDVFVSSSASPSGSLSWDDASESYSDEAVTGEEITISDEDQGFTAVLPGDDLAYLDYVEGMLMMAVVDNETEAYVEFGLTRNNLVDWNTGKVCSLFDGTLPVFGGQLVPLYDQTSNEHSRRSLIPVKLNGQYTYLVVLFPAGETEGRIIGANAGYDDNGLPIRSVTKLQDGDVIIPVYKMLYAVDGQEDLEEGEFDGDAITWKDGMTVTYEDMADEEDPTEMLFSFVFNDIFGSYTMSEVISFEI